MRHALRAIGLFAVLVSSIARPAGSQRGAGALPVTIPFELVGRHVIVQVTVNKSRPLSFVLDTGAGGAIVRTDVAKELGLKLEGQVNARGAGSGVMTGDQVKGATWSLVGLAGFTEPVPLALPMPELSPALGRPIDGIIGGEFIRQFVVELDYQARQIRLTAPDAFSYDGSGEVVPIEFVDGLHPTIAATVTPVGSAPVEGHFMFDIGSGQALVLHSPFVQQRKLLDGDLKTIRAIGGAGVGGKVTGRLGRVDALQVGSVTLPAPITMFSQDEAGAFANPRLAGNIGAAIAMRFRIVLDYRRQRMILEPTADARAPFDRAFSGIVLRASGSNFRTLGVTDVLEDSPAAAAGLQIGDELTAIDGVSVDRLTLPAVNEMFEKPVRYTLTIRRAGQTQTVMLTPARLI